MNGHLKIALLGKPEIWLDDEQLTIERLSVKGQALLGYLAVTGESYSRAFLATLLWGKMGEERARANLRLVLAQMRHSVDPYLVIDRQRVRFNFDQPHWLDVAEFQSCLATVAKGQMEPLRAASALYRGDFLDDFYVPEAPDFEEWARLEQERFRQMAFQALSELAEDARQKGEFKEAIQATRRLLQLEPWSEESHQQLIWLLAYSGQRSAALAQYEICKRVLAEELAVEVAPATTQLYEQIRREAPTAPHQHPVRASLALAEAIPAQRNLPTHLSTMIGREADLAHIATLLNTPECCLLTLIGPGGIGKSRLAIAAVEREQPRFLDGVTFVSLVGVNPTSPDEAVDLLINSIANALRYDFSAQRPARELLLNHLADKEMLLLLDNFEQMQPAAEFLSEILQNASSMKLLVTSRIRLGVEAEWLIDVAGLPYPLADATDSDAADSDLEYPAVHLFEQVARRTRASFTLATEKANVEHICRLLAGFPLAIELAANWVRSLTCSEIIARLEGDREAGLSTGLDILATTTSVVAERHQNMRLVLANSWSFLSADEQQSFRQLSLFQGGLEREAAEVVTCTTLPLLAALVDKSWLRRDADGRFQIHELLRQFGAEQMSKVPGEQLRTQQKHCLYYAKFLGDRSIRLEEESNRSDLTELDREIENIRALWPWLLTQKDANALTNYLEGLWPYYELKGWFQEAVIVIAQAATLPDAPALQKARWNRWLGEAYYQMGELTKSRNHFEVAMELLGLPLPKSRVGWGALAVKQVLRQAMHRLWPFYARENSPKKRIALVEGARTIGRLGQVYYFAEEKAPLLTAALYDLNLTERAGASAEVARGYAMTTLTLSNIPLHRLSAFYFRLCEQTTDQIDRVVTGGFIFEVMGVYKMGIGHWSEATANLERSAELLARLELRRWWEETRMLQALIAYHQGCFSQSAELFAEALQSARHRGDPLAQFWALLGLTECSLRLGGIQAGNRMFLLNEAKTLLDKYLGRTEAIRYYGVLGLVYLEQGDPQRAWQAANEASRLIRQSSFWMFWSFEGYVAPAEIIVKLWERYETGDRLVADGKAFARLAHEGCKALHDFARIYPPGQPRAWLNQGGVHWLEGDPAKAFQCWRKSLALAEELNMPYEQACAHYEIGRHLPADDTARQQQLLRCDEICAHMGCVSPTHIAFTPD